MCHINENLNNSLNNTPEVEDSSLIELCVQSRTSRHREIIKVHPVSTSGPSFSKLTASLVNEMLKFQTYLIAKRLPFYDEKM